MDNSAFRWVSRRRLMHIVVVKHPSARLYACFQVGSEIYCSHAEVLLELVNGLEPYPTGRIVGMVLFPISELFVLVRFFVSIIAVAVAVVVGLWLVRRLLRDIAREVARGIRDRLSS